jgi:hypothetical protein
MDTKESEVIDLLRSHYDVCHNAHSPLQHLKMHYGPRFKFESLGLGKYGQWINKNSGLFLHQKAINTLMQDVECELVTEDQLLSAIVKFFEESDNYGHRKHVLGHLRRMYGNRPFSSFGFGSFSDFIGNYGLDMGVAKREDFRSQREWKEWDGRR